ncbi:hypothetical protein AAFF_G00140000 [Aldrovandia affinis]|uniref:Uncharacterized protein n=1 Tax=Aldrovandia affinis TaxID=143900 RepID=A0AAD7TC99_9TELE|nr:hypothetical protein AAFF_G00140000 [Aldrovandia affinis]
MAPDSALQELKGILDTFKKPTPAQYKAGATLGSAETELERVLQRRRCAFETTQDNRSEASLSPFPSSVLDMTRVKRTWPQAQPGSPVPMTSEEPSGPDPPPDTLTPASTEVISKEKGNETNGESPKVKSQAVPATKQKHQKEHMKKT